MHNQSMRIIETVIKEPNIETVFCFLLLIAGIMLGSFVLTLSFMALYEKLNLKFWRNK